MTAPAYCAAIPVTLWCVAAVYFDVRNHSLAVELAATILVVQGLALYRGYRRKRNWLVWGFITAAVATWWLLLVPPRDAAWQPDVARLAWTKHEGDRVTIHNVRDCDYVTEEQYTCRWETETVNISQLDGVDLFIVHWGSPLIAHAIVSFRFPEGKYVAISIEARKTVGQSYSAIRGFFRQYTLAYVVAKERDVVRLRTNFRKGEDVRLYRTRMTRQDSRKLFRAYLGWVDQLAERPEWYNALTQNCTRGVTAYLAREHIGGVSNWDWRTVFNGKGDEMLYQLGDLEEHSLSFPELKNRALINPIAQKLDDTQDFSELIRTSGK